MKKTLVTLVALVSALLVVSLGGCSVKSKEAEAVNKKVADQHLVTYNPVRRLIYRNACATEGPITVCVEKIIVSETGTFVETSMKNSSKNTYSFGNGSRASAFLTNEGGEKLEWAKDGSGTYLEPGEKAAVLFRMGGHLKGEPATFLLSGIGTVQAEGSSNQLEKEYSLLVELIR